MHLGLIGCSSAGKTTLAKAIVAACRDRGISAHLSEDFVLRRLHLAWLSSPFLRRRALEVVSFTWLLFGWRRHRRYLAFALRLIANAPGGWLYRFGLWRLTVRKLALHALIDGAVHEDQIVVSDNEAALQAAHHLLVHPEQEDEAPDVPAIAEAIHELVRLSPHADLVAYIRVSEAELVERVMRRGHGRLGVTGRRGVARFVARTVEAFEAILASPATDDYLFVVEPEDRRSSGVDITGPSTWPEMVKPFLPTALRVMNRHPHRPRHVGSDSELVADLIESLNRNGIVYCCLDNGYADARFRSEGLALLVDETDDSEARRLLTELGFKEVSEAGSSPHPAPPAYFGLDRSSGELVCVRVGTQAAFQTGASRGYRIPLESLLLEEARWRGETRVPSPESALILFVLRTVTELGTLWGLRSWARTRDETRDEVRWLATQCSTEEALRLVDTYCSWVDRMHFLACLQALFEGRSRAAMLRLSWRFRPTVHQRSEAGWIRGGPAVRTSWLSRHPTTASGTPWRLPSGGAVVAFVGPDATGKSTLAGDVVSLLRPYVRVERVHLGKPPASAWTWGLNVGVKLLQAVRGRRPRWKPAALKAAEAERTWSVGPATLVYGIRAVALAYDRRRALLRAVRVSRRGVVVVCDRYPNQVVGAMDGPRLPADAPGRGVLSGPYRFLARLERRLYDRLPPPDVLIRLSVSIEEAQRRNRERAKADKHTEAELEERHSLPPVAWPVREDRVKDVDTGRPLDESRLSVRRAVWAAL
ncbi:MAG: hypothetical protein HKN72_10980 [Gemmatimonadetes bacterium]|nr:hypothetical protein [Gemmatimonadota bacterium]NNF13741.1 hypothetical protein [Gemmatimonadota bacterium]